MNPSIIIRLPKLKTTDDRQIIYFKIDKGSLLQWTKEEVKTIVESRNLGKPKEIILQTDEEGNQVAVVHFEHWFRPEIAKHFLVGGNMTVNALYSKRAIIDLYKPKKAKK